MSILQVLLVWAALEVLFERVAAFDWGDGGLVDPRLRRAVRHGVSSSGKVVNFKQILWRVGR